jgi:hypothetical protein
MEKERRRNEDIETHPYRELIILKVFKFSSKKKKMA